VANEIINNQVFHVTLTGGEPLTALKLYEASILKLVKAGIDINLNSNLALLDDAQVALLKRSKVRSILTSLMSFDEATHDLLSNKRGSFQATCRGISKAVQNGIPVAVNMVVTKKNLDHVAGTGQLAKRLGAVGFCATKASKPASCENFNEYHLSADELKKMFTELLKVHKDTGIHVDSLEHYPACAFPDSETRTLFGGRSCSAGKSGCTIGFDGLIRPCSHAQQTYGNVANGLRTAWEAMGIWRSGELVPDICKVSCKEFPKRCGGGCRVEANNCVGSIVEKDPYCCWGSVPDKLRKQNNGINPSSLFIPSRNIRFREEAAGHLAYLNVKNWLLTDSALMVLLKSYNGFRATDLAAVYNVDVERTYATLRLLVSKKLVNAGGREST
jgi:radical SAM protein with 4Fe4S-binding SPASM domain